MRLETNRLVIRNVEESDWKSLQAIWKSFHASAYAQYDMPHPTDDEAVRARIARWARANGSVEHMFFAVCLQDRVIGYIACNQRAEGYELGYCFHSDVHGRGYAKESHLALFGYLCSLGVTKLTAGTALANTPSVALLESLGFRLIGKEKVSFYQDEGGNDIVFDGGIFERDISLAPGTSE